ncbi:hypothetical protein [Sphingomonas sp. ERG5]|uniref:hypothetical protein n=1 Tax=Sphingomonas sp. ERG5 TaxID=1381597 RepID=UPI00054C62BA|nr:hypothetical protein [Sphingomonas sp. ERG5]
MNRLVAILYSIAIAGIALLFGRMALDGCIYLYEENAGGQVALAVTGWLISTLGPIALSVCVWLMVRRLKARWLVHLIFIPTSFVTFRDGASLFFYGAGVSGENSPEGYALLMASAFMLLTLLVHAAALIVEAYKKVMHRSPSR